MPDLTPLFYRRWYCNVLETGFLSAASRCRPSEPHDNNWSCGYRWTTEPPTDEVAAAYGLVHVDPKVEALAQVLWAYYVDSDSDSWEGADQKERDECISDAQYLINDIKKALE